MELLSWRPDAAWQTEPVSQTAEQTDRAAQGDAERGAPVTWQLQRTQNTGLLSQGNASRESCAEP